jgi:hypothetical protein
MGFGATIAIYRLGVEIWAGECPFGISEPGRPETCRLCLSKLARGRHGGQRTPRLLGVTTGSLAAALLSTEATISRATSRHVRMDGRAFVIRVLRA